MSKARTQLLVKHKITLKYNNSYQVFLLYFQECKSGYVARGSVCYKKMTKKPWKNATCPLGDEFMSVEDEDENNFINEQFVKSSKQSFWINARVCGYGKLCAQDFGALRYHNFCGPFPASGCVQMRYGKNRIWITKNCNIPSYYICKYSEYSY